MRNYSILLFLAVSLVITSFVTGNDARPPRRCRQRHRRFFRDDDRNRDPEQMTKSDEMHDKIIEVVEHFQEGWHKIVELIQEHQNTKGQIDEGDVADADLAVNKRHKRHFWEFLI